MPWSVIMRPVRASQGTVEVGGVAVLISDGEHEHEMVRVGFQCERSKNPDEEFIERLVAELQTAEEAAELISDYEERATAAQEEARQEAERKLRELVKGSRAGKMA